jgi:hypothetical protein
MMGQGHMMGQGRERGQGPPHMIGPRANHFSNNGSHRSGSHQFGQTNPNFQRNLALMGVYQRNQQQLSQQTSQQTSQQSSTSIPAQFNQIVNAINCAYSNGCFGQNQYSTQAYNMIMNILYMLPPNSISMIQSAVQNSNYQFTFSNAGALWANLTPAQQNAIIAGINCGSTYQCISQNTYNMLQKLLNILNSYSGAPQTLLGNLTNNYYYNTCMENAPNSSVCNYFLEADSVLANNNYQYLSEYN